MNGESYVNGWIGGAANGTIQTVGTMVAGPMGTIVGGAAGGFTGSVIIDCLNDRGKKNQEIVERNYAERACIGYMFCAYQRCNCAYTGEL